MYTKKIFVSRSFDESFKLGCEAEYEAISKAIKELRHENISLAISCVFTISSILAISFNGNK